MYAFTFEWIFLLQKMYLKMSKILINFAAINCIPKWSCIKENLIFINIYAFRASTDDLQIMEVQCSWVRFWVNILIGKISFNLRENFNAIFDIKTPPRLSRLLLPGHLYQKMCNYINYFMLFFNFLKIL